MRPIFLLFFLAGMLSSVFSQAYRIIDPARDYYYGDMNRVIHIDSVAVGNSDTLYFNYELIDFCYPYGLPQWLSQPVRVDTAGVYTFQNDSSETIVLHSQSQPGDSWTLYTYPNGRYLDASHTATSATNVLGATDSVKEIVLALKDTLGNPAPSVWNGKSFRISQQQGLIQTYNFDHFPQDTVSYRLRGVSNPEVGRTGITIREIFDFEVGDEIQVLERYSYASPGYATYITDRILSKEVLEDTVWFEIDRWTFSINYASHDTNWTHYVFTQQILLIDYAEFPYESPQSGFSIAWYSPFLVVGEKIIKLYGAVYYLDVQACWQELPDFQDFCIEGLGCGYYNGSYAGLVNERWPTYFNQNGITWGNRFNFEDFITSRDPLQESLSLRLYPNPVSDVLHLKLGQGTAGKAARFELYDALGRLHLQSEVPATGEQEIAVEMLKPGVYFYRLSAAGGGFASGKIIKR